MSLLLIGGFAAALIGTQAHQSATKNSPQAVIHAPPDPVLYAALGPGMPGATELHDQLRKEERDDVWARNIEPELRGRYSAIPHVNDRGEVRVTCAATLCEVANELPGKDQATAEELKTLYVSLQSGPLFADVKRMGLTYLGSTFTDTKGMPSHPLFAAYWARWRKDELAADPMLDPALPKAERGQRGYYAQLRSETRDPAWADRTEAALGAILNQVPALQGAGHRARATCAVTLCEITAMTAPGAPQSAVDAFFNELQTYKFNADIEKVGLNLKESGVVFTAVPNDKKRNLYVSYWTRSGG